VAENRTEQLRDEIATLTDALDKRVRQVQRQADALSRKLKLIMDRADAARKRARKLL
jgi:hypothetical protein